MHEQQALPSPPEEASGHATGNTGEALDHNMELRLMHEWTAFASKTFSTAWEFWCYQAPLIALDYRYAMDALLGLAALHSAKRHPSHWTSTEARFLAARDPLYTLQKSQHGPEESWKADPGTLESPKPAVLTDAADQALVAAKRSLEMINISRQYFDRAIDGHRKALTNMTVDNIKSVCMTSVLVAFNALFMLSEDEKHPALPAVDPILWLRLGSGTLVICQRWRELVGEGWRAASGAFYGTPDLSDNDELFKPEHAKPFEHLLTYAQEYEHLNDDDQETYARALSYIGLIYKGIRTKSDQPVATCRRLVAMPSRLPLRFTVMVEQRQSRAMAILAHVFACMKLLDDEVLWFKGVAERQIPKIQHDLPSGWKEMLEWPMAVARANRGESSGIGEDITINKSTSKEALQDGV